MDSKHVQRAALATSDPISQGSATSLFIGAGVAITPGAGATYSITGAAAAYDTAVAFVMYSSAAVGAIAIARGVAIAVATGERERDCDRAGTTCRPGAWHDEPHDSKRFQQSGSEMCQVTNMRNEASHLLDQNTCPNSTLVRNMICC